MKKIITGLLIVGIGAILFDQYLKVKKEHKKDIKIIS